MSGSIGSSGLRGVILLAALTLAACGSGESATDLSPDSGLDVPMDSDFPDGNHDVMPPEDATQHPDDATGDDLQTPTDAADDTAGDADTVEEPDIEGPPYARHVNPFIGTGGGLANVGSALPGATAPLGLVKVSPDTKGTYGITKYQHCGGYFYGDERIIGFSHNHLHGTGAPDYGNLLVMPTIGMTEAKTGRWGLEGIFTHEDELASPGYYAVTLTEPSVRVELTATTRCAHHRYRFLGDDPVGTIAFDAASAMVNGRSAGGEIDIDTTTGEVSGWNWNDGEFSGRYDGFPVHFTMRFSRQFASHGTWLDGALRSDTDRVETDSALANYGAWFDFDTATDPVVEVQVCLSYTSVEAARAARDAEMEIWDFEGTRQASFFAWDRELSRIQVTGGTADEKAIFYTAIYHVLQMPTIWSDVDGSYYGFDRQVHPADGWTYYTDMSFWDTFRTQHPLLTLVWPQQQRDMMRSLAAMVAQGGWMPKWPMGAGDTGSMIGQHGASVVVDTWLKGLRDFDVESMWPVMKATADGPLPAGAYGRRDCIEKYVELGYIPHDECGESVSKTLEYAFNDYCLAELARDLGHDEDADRYGQRAGNFANLWDDDTGFFRPRFRDGTWEPKPPFDPLSFWSNGYTEGSPWQWRWFAPHDESGLRALFGDNATFLAQLIEFFEVSAQYFDFEIPNSWYFHGNEPDIHAPFLFIGAGRPDLTQKWVRWLMDTNYRNTYDGLIGNDDAGTISAWYVFSAVGLFPWPCFPGYYITTPLFDRVVMHLPGGDLVVEAPGASAGTRYISEARFNGELLEGYWLTHEQVAAGGTLSLTLSETP